MTYKNAVKRFVTDYMNVNRFYDYGQAFEMWSAYVDNLNRDGEITDKQRFYWGTPFKYGKTVAVNLNGHIYYKV